MGLVMAIGEIVDGALSELVRNALQRLGIVFSASSDADGLVNVVAWRQDIGRHSLRGIDEHDIATACDPVAMAAIKSVEMSGKYDRSVVQFVKTSPANPEAGVLYFPSQV